jgi:hypothetical protein
MFRWFDKRFPAIFLTLLLLVSIAAFTKGAGSRRITETYTVPFSVNETQGDTAQSYLFTPLFALDSYIYACSILTTTTPVDSQGIVYRTPAQRMKLSLKVTTIDTTRNYICSVATATTNYGIIWNPPEAAWTAATAYDTLVYLINNKAGLKDSVKAEDSTTYIMLRSKLRQVPTMGGTRFTVWGDADTMRFDTLTRANTIATICAGLRAAAVAVTDLNTQYTLTNEDTAVRITAKKAGLPFVWKNPAAGIVCPVDTLDTTVVQANIKGTSWACDTFDLMQLITDQRRIGALYGNIKIHASADTNRSLGTIDSGRIWLQTRVNNDTGTQYFPFDSAVTLLIPCSLHVAKAYAAANDTIFKEILCLIWRVSDTLSDTTFQTEYDISVDLNILDQ